MIKLFLVAMTLVLMGCTHTRTVDLDSAEADLAFAEINSKAEQKTPTLKVNEWRTVEDPRYQVPVTRLELSESEAVEVPELHLRPDSASWWNDQLDSVETIATEEIYEISFKSSAPGALGGLQVGGILGFFTGAVASAAFVSGGCLGDPPCPKEDMTGAAIVGGLVFGAMFGLVGAGIGAAVGGKYRYRFLAPAPTPPPPMTSTYTPPHRNALRIRLCE